MFAKANYLCLLVNVPKSELYFVSLRGGRILMFVFLNCIFIFDRDRHTVMETHSEDLDKCGRN